MGDYGNEGGGKKWGADFRIGQEKWWDKGGEKGWEKGWEKVWEKGGKKSRNV